jgi:gamma-glutamyltranspeptidase/glutathione hydrolase
MAMSQRDPRLSAMVQSRTEVTSDRGVVSAGHPRVVQAALDVLEAGGSAMDAVIAGAFVSYVVEPNNAGIAGYGHLSAFLADERTFLSVDHNPRAPLAAAPGMYELEPGHGEGHQWPGVVGDRNAVGHLAVAVPGAVGGLYAAHRRGGRLPWAELLQPAVHAARQGVEVTWNLQLLIAGRLEEIRARGLVSALLLPGGRLPGAANADAPGDRLDQRDLADTLELIAQRGPAGFYEGEVAQAIAAEIGAGGGIVDAEDLRAYRPKVLDEPPATYRGFDYVTCNDQVGYEALNILACFPLSDFAPGSAEHLHLLAEAFGHAFADNATHYGDPEHTASPVRGLASPAFGARRAAAIRLDRAAPRPVGAADPWPFEGAPGAPEAAPPPSAGGVRGTTQVVAADADGNMVALITTIGDDFGSLVLVPGTGILLNNSMMNFDPRPGRSNSIAPGKMPFFAVPAVVAAREGRAVLAAAGSGGYPILAGVLHTTVGVLDHGLGVQAAIDVPRVHSQGEQTFVESTVAPDALERLAAMGHDLVVQETSPGSLAFSRVSAVAVDAGGRMTAGSGPAWNTAAGGL